MYLKASKALGAVTELSGLDAAVTAPVHTAAKAVPYVGGYFFDAFGWLFADRFALPKLIPVGVGLEGGWAWASGSLDQKDSKVAAVHPQIGNIGARILDVRQAPDGYVYVLTDGPDGKLVRLQSGQ